MSCIIFFFSNVKKSSYLYVPQWKILSVKKMTHRASTKLCSPAIFCIKFPGGSLFTVNTELIIQDENNNSITLLMRLADSGTIEALTLDRGFSIL